MINVLTNSRDERFCPVGENTLITHSSNKNLKLPFQKIKIGIQSLSYVGPNTWNSLHGNLKSATSDNSFKHYIKEYFLKKLQFRTKYLEQNGVIQ